jgi:hypothetical protein
LTKQDATIPNAKQPDAEEGEAEHMEEKKEHTEKNQEKKEKKRSKEAEASRPSSQSTSFEPPVDPKGIHSFSQGEFLNVGTFDNQ